MTTTADAPPVGELVRVRGQQWVVSRSRLSAQARDTLRGRAPCTALTSVSYDDFGAETTVAWDVEPDREVLLGPRLP